MGCYLTNTWWRDDAKGVCINLSKRFSYSIYALITTLKEYTVLISLILGIVLILFAEWINVTSNEQQKKMDQPFIDIDVFIGQTIQNLNYLTQDVPNMAISWTNQTMYQSGGVANSVLQTSFNSISNTLNTGTTGLENIANQLVQFFYSQTGKSNPPTISIPSVNIGPYNLATGWEPSLSPVDLSELKIPNADFSVYREVSPFIQQVYNVPRTGAYYIEYAAIILLIYAGIRLFIALISPFLPRPDFDWCCGISCGKVISVSSEGVQGFFRMLSKPWVHVPLTFGICLVLLVVLFLNPNIQKLNTDMKTPLYEADVATSNFISQVNNFIQAIPTEAINWINEQEKKIWEDVTNFLDQMMFSLLYDFNEFIRNDIQNTINQLLLDIGDSNTVTFPSFESQEVFFLIPRNLLPPIPYIPTDDLLIPTNLLNIEKPLSPWVNDIVGELQSISNSILIFGIWLIVLPGIVCLWGFLKPFIPRKVNNFFENPDFKEATNKEKERPILP